MGLQRKADYYELVKSIRQNHRIKSRRVEGFITKRYEGKEPENFLRLINEFIRRRTK